VVGRRQDERRPTRRELTREPRRRGRYVHLQSYCLWIMRTDQIRRIRNYERGRGTAVRSGRLSLSGLCVPGHRTCGTCRASRVECRLRCQIVCSVRSGGKARSVDSRRTNVHGMYLSSCCNLFSNISTSFSRNENVRSETSIDFDSLERPFVRESAMPRSVRLYTNLHYPLSEHLAVVAVSVS
jgi:hypothetical protein